MSDHYAVVQWNRQKRRYDAALALILAAYIAAFLAVTLLRLPWITLEIALMRAIGSAAFGLLHVILSIGPLCRLSPRFLPLLYNRRHAGVTLALLATAHALLVVLTYHAEADVPPLLSLLEGTPLSRSRLGVPFQWFGAGALVILLLMAATSHDFWLRNLTAPVWKALHMMVYAAYGLLVLHVVFGVLQSEQHWIPATATAAGAAGIGALHWMAARRERRRTAQVQPATAPDDEGFVEVCTVASIPPNRARIVHLAGERVAVFRHDGGISAVSNVCQHQNGPLGEGRIVDGCITCPWHGYQYDPATGASPPPFTEKVPTFHVRVHDGRVFVHPKPNPPGTPVSPASDASASSVAATGRPIPTLPVA
jgi:nitrite reductase/ring-hydroxylating ferredoxin subunit/DMSO/TMAO reductase YedYZ heme-binding membrane subunit